MTIQMVSALMATPLLKDRDHGVMIVIANHCGECEWMGEEEASFPSIPMIAMEARTSEKTVARATRIMEALGVLRKFKGEGRSTNIYVPNTLWLEHRRRHYHDLRKRLRLEHGPKGWLEPFVAEVNAERERLYTDGVPKAMTPPDWPYPDEGRAGIIAEACAACGDSVTGQEGKKRAKKDKLSVQEKPRCADSERRCADSERRCADSQVSPKPSKPYLNPDARVRERRQEPGDGAFDQPERVQEAFERMVIHWVTTGKWSPPSGYNGGLGPPPDDREAPFGFGLGPHRLSGVIVSVLTPAEKQGKHYRKGAAGVLASRMLEAMDGPERGAILQRFETIRRLKDHLLEARDTGRWSPPPVPAEGRNGAAAGHQPTTSSSEAVGHEKSEAA